MADNSSNSPSDDPSRKPGGNDRDKSGMNAFARYLSLGILLPASTLVGYAAGYGLDQWLGTHVLKMICMVLGTAGGFVQLVRSISK